MSSFLHRLYRNETRVPFIARRKWFYAASGLLIVIFALSFVFRGFNEGVEFAGGTQFQIPVTGTSITTDQVGTAFDNAGHAVAEPPQQVGSGSTRQIIVKTESLTADNGNGLKTKVAQELGLKPSAITDTTVSSSWGHDVTVKAIEGLVIFLIAVSIYIAIRYQWRMTVGGVLALLHDLIVTAGVYSLIGLQVTPSTIVGLLTILGFSMYDTVVVYDKVAENAKNILAGTRMTYSEAANLAVNQTLMRSINTSLVALLPVAGLLFVGVGLLGVGTLEDLALVLFVGLASGAYSSLFLATPIVVDLTEREPQYKQLTKRVMAKRASEAKKLADAELVATAAGTTVAAPRPAGQPAPAPKPGARPQRRRK
jgi:preprotein translocase subunit SecF